MKVIGILGGMGHYATIDLYQKILLLWPNKASDQAFPRIVIEANPHIPDRTAAILGIGEDPFTAMLQSLLVLEQVGCEVIGISCNTAHRWHEPLATKTGMTLVHMIAETSQTVRSEGYRRVGLLATTGTIQSHLYQDELQKHGIELILPDDHGQSRVMDLIYGTTGAKTGFAIEPRKKLLDVCYQLSTAGAQAVIAGCTEVSMLLKEQDTVVRIFDPSYYLARKLVELSQ